jgi:endonuclease YncB( thermonuclease family)
VLVMTISLVRLAGQCSTVDEQDVIVMRVVEMTVEVVNEAAEVMVPFTGYEGEVAEAEADAEAEAEV